MHFQYLKKKHYFDWNKAENIYNHGHESESRLLSGFHLSIPTNWDISLEFLFGARENVISLEQRNRSRSTLFFPRNIRSGHPTAVDNIFESDLIGIPHKISINPGARRVGWRKRDGSVERTVDVTRQFELIRDCYTNSARPHAQSEFTSLFFSFLHFHRESVPLSDSAIEFPEIFFKITRGIARFPSWNRRRVKSDGKKLQFRIKEPL